MSGFFNTGSGSAGSVLPNAAKYPALHQALGQVLSGAGDATLLIIGDSIASGLFTTNIGPGITTAMVRILANQLGIPVTEGLGIPLGASAAGPDNRWTLGTGWSYGSTFFGGLSWGGLASPNGVALIGAPSAAGAASFQPQVGTFDTFDVYYIGAVTTFDVNFNGGANTPTGGGSGVQKVTVSGAATSRPVCNFNTVGAGGLGATIVGVDARLSTTPTLRVGNASVTAADTSGSSNGPASANGSALQCISVYNPNVVLINLGFNDPAHGISLAQSITNWQTLATAAKACQGGAGGIIFASENPINPVSNASIVNQYVAYWAQLKAFCAQNGYGFIDIFNGLNAEAGFTPLAAMSPSYYGDGNSVHPSTNPGSPDYGRMMALGLLGL